MDVKFRVSKSMIVPAIIEDIKYKFKRIRSAWRRFDTLNKSESTLLKYFIEDIEDMFVTVTSIQKTKCGNYTAYYIKYTRNKTDKVIVFSFDSFTDEDLKNIERLKQLTRLEITDME